MGNTDSNPESVLHPYPARPENADYPTPPALYMAEGTPSPEPSSLTVFRLALEEEPEYFLYAIGKTLKPSSREHHNRPTGALSDALHHLEGAIRSRSIEYIAGVDETTRVALESDGDYQLIVNKYGRTSLQARLRMISAYLIRQAADAQLDSEDTESGEMVAQ